MLKWYYMLLYLRLVNYLQGNICVFIYTEALYFNNLCFIWKQITNPWPWYTCSTFVTEISNLGELKLHKLDNIHMWLVCIIKSNLWQTDVQHTPSEVISCVADKISIAFSLYFDINDLIFSNKSCPSWTLCS